MLTEGKCNRRLAWNRLSMHAGTCLPLVALYEQKLLNMAPTAIIPWIHYFDRPESRHACWYPFYALSFFFCLISQKVEVPLPKSDLP